MLRINDEKSVSASDNRDWSTACGREASPDLIEPRSAGDNTPDNCYFIIFAYLNGCSVVVLYPVGCHINYHFLICRNLSPEWNYTMELKAGNFECEHDDDWGWCTRRGLVYVQRVLADQQQRVLLLCWYLRVREKKVNKECWLLPKNKAELFVSIGKQSAGWEVLAKAHTWREAKCKFRLIYSAVI